MKHIFTTLLLILVATLTSVKAQTYTFETIHNPSGCEFTYDIDIVVKLEGVRVTQIYSDDGTTGSFAFEAYFNYSNVFSNSTLPAGDF